LHQRLDHQVVRIGLEEQERGPSMTVNDPRARSLTSRRRVEEFLRSTAMRGAPILTSGWQVVGNAVTWSERPDSEALHTNDVTVQAVVLNGKIQSRVYRPGKVVQAPGESPARVDTVTPEAAGMNLAALVLLGFGLLSFATVFAPVRSNSNLRGRLMHDLRHWRATGARASRSTS
jgi:hypothetical protein